MLFSRQYNQLFHKSIYDQHRYSEYQKTKTRALERSEVNVFLDFVSVVFYFREKETLSCVVLIRAVGHKLNTISSDDNHKEYRYSFKTVHN